MRKTFFCGVDLHSNNAMYVVTDQKDKLLLKKRLPNRLPVVLESLTIHLSLSLAYLVISIYIKFRSGLVANL